jgi:hypothetical protein
MSFVLLEFAAAAKIGPNDAFVDEEEPSQQSQGEQVGGPVEVVEKCQR